MPSVTNCGFYSYGFLTNEENNLRAAGQQKWRNVASWGLGLSVNANSSMQLIEKLIREIC